MNTLVYIAGFIAVVCLSVVHGNGIICDGHSSITGIKCNNVDMMVKKPTLCQLKKGENATLLVNFAPGVASKKLKAVCHGIIAGIPVPFKNINEDGCSGMNPACPLQVKRNEAYTTTIFVDSKYPSLKLIIRWELVDMDGGNSGDVVCINIPAELV